MAAGGVLAQAQKHRQLRCACRLVWIASACSKNAEGLNFWRYAQAFAYTQPNLIAAGIYNAVHAVFPVCQVGNITYQSSDSRSSQSVPFDAFLQILPVRSPPPFSAA